MSLFITRATRMALAQRPRGRQPLLAVALGCGFLIGCGAPEAGLTEPPDALAEKTQALLPGGAALDSVLQLGEPRLQRVWGLAADGAAGVIAVGTFRGTIDVQPGSGVRRLYSAGELDGFLVRYGHDHTVRWARSFGSTSFDELYDVVVAASSVYVVGYEMDPKTSVARGVLARYSLSSGLATMSLVPSAVGDAIELSPSTRVWSGGTFQGRIRFPAGPTLSAPDLDGLLVRYLQGS